jgi:glutathione synthase/RimK-type ligase-like ATP-grasp enzyme
MKIAFQMDPIGDVNINADSSFRLAEEAQARGHSLLFPRQISLPRRAHYRTRAGFYRTKGAG